METNLAVMMKLVLMMMTRKIKVMIHKIHVNLSIIVIWGIIATYGRSSSFKKPGMRMIQSKKMVDEQTIGTKYC